MFILHTLIARRDAYTVSNMQLHNWLPCHEAFSIGRVPSLCLKVGCVCALSPFSVLLRYQHFTEYWPTTLQNKLLMQKLERY